MLRNANNNSFCHNDYQTVANDNYYRSSWRPTTECNFNYYNRNLYLDQDCYADYIDGQEQIEEIQRIQNHRLQQEWFMHRRIREFSVEMKALSRANSDTEFLLRQKSNDSDEVVAELRRRYEKSLGLSDVSLMETEYALQEEVRLLERFRDKVQRLQEEWEEIMRRREEEEERRKMRAAKIKKRFHLVIKTLAYFRKEKQPSSEQEAEAESATSASPKSPKKQKKLSFKKSMKSV